MSKLSNLEQSINPHWFSTLIKLLWVTSFVLHFIKQLQKTRHVAAAAVAAAAAAAAAAELNSLQAKHEEPTHRVNQFGLLIDLDKFIRC